MFGTLLLIDFLPHLSGRIEAGDLLVALRALGFEPKKDEVKKLMSDNDKENTGTITKQQFVEIFRAKWVSCPGADALKSHREAQDPATHSQNMLAVSALSDGVSRGPMDRPGFFTSS